MERQYCLIPADVSLEYGQYGKPVLAAHSLNLQFNIAHSGDLVLIAIARMAAVGVDVEWVKPLADAAAIQEATLHPNEINWISTQPDATIAFYRLWTRKEALLKAAGTGLTDYLTAIDATDGSRLQRTPAIVTGKTMQVVGFQADEHHCAAVSWIGEASQMVFIEFIL
ncbi:MAG: 4'-phosphopantetheinyl transferase superfamily protein, partial [Chitinophagia bacterium]|nr:4'-phosphopantetheinyl transferase superfamily protein [Chitinophagia bacterium]